MPPATPPPNERERLDALKAARILDTADEETFDRITRLAQQVFDVPIATVSLVDSDRQWFKSVQGLTTRETPRDGAFCAYTILDPDITVAEDAEHDARFFDSPLVTGDPGIRFYAGVPLTFGDTKQRIGALCVIDRQPRSFTAAQAELLTELGSIVSDQMTSRLLADRAEQANRAKSAFLAGMSHEIRTPLNAILGYCELLTEAAVAEDPAARNEAADAIRRNGAHLLELIEGILDFSQIESGAIKLEQRPIDPIHLLDEAILMLQSRAREKGLTLESRWVGPRPRSITTDPTRLRQILVNLVGNAIKFTARGAVKVEAWIEYSEGPICPPPRLALSIVDTGPGIDPAIVASIFDPFVRDATSGKENIPGNGLGLPIARRLAEMLGGTIQLDTNPGHGCRFTVHVRAADIVIADTSMRLTAAPGTELGSIAAETPALSLEGQKFLLAEDGPDNRRLVTAFLSRAGAVVEAVENGAEAIDAAMHAEPNAFDCVLMDLQMPVMDGHQATRALRAGGYKGTIIALTANATTDERTRCLHGGFDAFLTKPITKRALIESLACLPRHAA